MDHGEKEDRKRHPWERANLLSRITFFYTRGLFWRAYSRKKLEEDDLYEVASCYKSQKLGDELEEHVKDDLNSHKTPSIYRMLWSCYGKEYTFIGIMQLIMRTIIVMTIPMTLSKLVLYFEPGQTEITKEGAYFYAVLLISTNLINIIYTHNYMLTITALGIKVRTAFCSLMYRKALRLTPHALSDITMGKIVTLMTKDVGAFEMIILYGNDVWIGFVQAGIACYLIYRKMGVAAFVGVGFFLVVMPIQIFIGKQASALRMKTGKKTDERLQIIQEAISAIKIVKLFGWEDYFKSKILEARKLRHALSVIIPLGITQSAELHAAVERIGNLLKAEDIPRNNSETIEVRPKIIMKEVSVSTRQTEILKNVSLVIESGLTIITGPVGSGKTTLLHTLLKTFSPVEGIVSVTGRISYVPQEPWIFPSTLKQNIVFGGKLDQVRYEEVLRVCALNYDIGFFKGGDSLIIGDKGINLSKGQKARINLARAIYKDSDIYLLDDCLTALDARVKDYVFKECIRGFLRKKLCILVSHDVEFIKESDQLVVMENGTIKSFSKYTEVSGTNREYISNETKENDKMEESDVAKHDIKEDNEETQLLTSEIDSAKRNIYHEQQCIFYMPTGRNLQRLDTSNTTVGNVGLAITQSFMLSGLVQYGIRQWADLENKMTSVERVLEYTTTSRELKNVGSRPRDWPTRGKIKYENVSLLYRKSATRVLKDISFTVEPGQKIGIIGRTGAGKTSIISTLFRLYSFEGKITIDDIDITEISLEYLRNKISIIPQDPILFTGTIRSNIDPKGFYTDVEIWSAIEKVTLSRSIASLDSKVSDSGSHFSAGQRQLLCLARAIINNNNIIVLDEATANMDDDTGVLIHEKIEQNFSSCTIITVAHRLCSVLKSDKIMVIEDGRIMEYDRPSVLLKDSKGLFREMVEKAGLLEIEE
ncbi:hypothetical protein NQ318_001405 [Aromia moschata]|uniref:Multidrug resistance-associated protein lethal(2)03659 n=1 Tax=Aromia moschata TaxID=1265417 RepID=A0AAV8YXY6_9CUCU|nr:hypothetical protein NQ318_001405 [Aromia moschata]